MKICSGMILFTNVTLPHVSHITVLCIIKLSVKSIVAHDVKADRLSWVRWKNILDVHCRGRPTLAAYRCIEENNFDFKLQALPNLHVASWTSAVGIPSLIGFVYSVVVVFCRCLCTCLWSLCWRRCLRCAKRCSLCFAVVVFDPLADEC